ncbi:glycoside hydrolase [Byssothecium circinans]|uniref:AA9 family lytic polysaccharide monooxygenase n=1 Tax=Byssothecium circinans TaxID=147558 RepID=A0A6A5TTT2_9PLEO|nr:glycoside hydrolase [Byssothecium circinans]
MKFTIATALIALSGNALAHGGVQQYTIDGRIYLALLAIRWASPYEGQKDLIQRSWTALPHKDPTSSNLTCNYKGITVPGAFHARVPAGATITTTWNEQGFGWPHSFGPIVAYLALAFCGDDCTTIANITDLEWFKITEEGLREGYTVGESVGWFQDDLWENRRTDHWDIVLPKTLKPGRYLVRHEIIMHELDLVQFYPNCAALEITGEGESVPGKEFLVKFPGAYSLSDPGIAISGHVRGDLVTKNYTVPGPKVWTG